MFLKAPFWTLLVIIVLLAAAAVRMYGLETRMMHGDEAVHASKYIQWINGEYHYDARDYHGPVLYMLTWPVMSALGIHDLAAMEVWQIRCVTAAVGVALVGLVLVMSRLIGRGPALVAAAFMAVSPIMVYYSRYYIQEIILAIASLAAVFCMLELLEPGETIRPRRAWGCTISLGILFGIMHGTKETYIITVAAIAAAAGVTWWLAQRDGTLVEAQHRKVDLQKVLRMTALAVLIWIIVGALLITSFGRDPNAIAVSLHSWFAYADRGNGAGDAAAHIHPWWFFGERLLFWMSGTGNVVSEAVILLMALLAVLFVATGRMPARNRRIVIFLTAYTAVVTLAYEMIPYKTPWCALQFWTPTIVLAGIGAVQMTALLASLWLRGAWLAILALCLTQLTFQMVRLNFTYPNGGIPPRNPWAYAHPVPDVANGAAEIERIYAANPDHNAFVIAFIGPDRWPWPWYLRHEPNVGYWDDAASVNFLPTFVIAGETDAKSVRERWPDRFFETTRGLRPDVRKVIFIERSAWVKYVDSRRTNGVRP